MELLQKIEDNPQSVEKGSLLWLGMVLIPAGISLLSNKEMIIPALVLIVLGTISVFTREFRKL